MTTEDEQGEADEARYMQRMGDAINPELRKLMVLQLITWMSVVEEEFATDEDRADDDGYRSWDIAKCRLAQLAGDIRHDELP